MMKYTLKKGQPAFDVVDGPMAGRSFNHGQTYTEIPQADVKKFAEIKPEKATAKTKAKGDN